LCALTSVFAVRARNQTYVRTITFPSFPFADSRGTDFRMKSVWSGDYGGGNALIVDASVTIVPRWVLRFFGASTGVIQAFALRWSLLKIIEYTEVNNQTGFQADFDNITAAYSLLDPLAPANRRWTAWVKNLNNATGMHQICASLNPSQTAPSFTVQLCGTFCTKSMLTTRTGPGATCGKPNRSCKPGGTHWSMRIDQFPWTDGSAGIAVKVVFDTRQAIREIKRDGSTLTDETDPDPQEPIQTANVTDDENDSVNDLGDESMASWERTVDISGSNCSACAVATLVREIYKSGEWTRDNDAFDGSGLDQNVVTGRTIRVSYISMIPSGLPQCKPDVLMWDPDFWSLNASGAFGLVPSLALLGVLVALFQ